MDKKVINYQKILLSFLHEEAESKTIPDIDFQVIEDIRNNHFLLIENGWIEKRYFDAIVFHFQIKTGGKVWILANNTDVLVAEELVKRGIPSADIVLGFHAPSTRQYTGFAVA